MKKIIFPALVAIVLIAVPACKKSGAGTAPVTSQPKCVIIAETNSLVGNEKNFKYQYDSKGLLTLVNVTNSSGALSLGNYQTSGNGVTYNTVSTYSGKPVRAITVYDINASDIYSELPTSANVSIFDGDTLRVNYYSYFFFYNDKKQLIKVGEQTNHIVGDWEYDLNISYNDQGNVSKLEYVWTTGPTGATTPYIVTAYDDKPTPYAAVKGWPFFMVNFAWNNSDPEPIITALSKNNPLNFSSGSGTALFTRTMEYTYNSNGFPTERKNTNKNSNGEYTFLQTFTYNCN